MPEATSRQRLLVVLLRLFGSSSLLALIFVAAPHAWMRDIHNSLGLGAMPESPVVWYLARSTSALYAILGGLFWLLSFDPVKYRTVLRYLGFAILVFGCSLFAIDHLEGLPAFWVFWEGPVVIAYGVLIVWCTQNLGAGRSAGS